MKTTADRMRALLVEANAIALDHFGKEAVANVPLLVTHIALTMTQIEEGNRVSPAGIGDPVAHKQSKDE